MRRVVFSPKLDGYTRTRAHKQAQYLQDVLAVARAQEPPRLEEGRCELCGGRLLYIPDPPVDLGPKRPDPELLGLELQIGSRVESSHLRCDLQALKPQYVAKYQAQYRALLQRLGYPEPETIVERWAK